LLTLSVVSENSEVPAVHVRSRRACGERHGFRFTGGNAHAVVALFRRMRAKAVNPERGVRGRVSNARLDDGPHLHANERRRNLRRATFLAEDFCVDMHAILRFRMPTRALYHQAQHERVAVERPSGLAIVVGLDFRQACASHAPQKRQ
jgi:hypothetical protein